MIVAVEGPSAAGKTTWCHHHTRESIDEYTPNGEEPDGSDTDAQAAYWADVNSARWCAATDLEQREGVAFCDSDPLKLHYSWCLYWVGASPRSRFDAEYARTRQKFVTGTLGFADLTVISLPPRSVLQTRRINDHNRRRRSFELHASLIPALKIWYRTVSRLDTQDRVLWQFPSSLVFLAGRSARPHRSDPLLLDQLVGTLPDHP